MVWPSLSFPLQYQARAATAARPPSTTLAETPPFLQTHQERNRPVWNDLRPSKRILSPSTPSSWKIIPCTLMSRYAQPLLMNAGLPFLPHSLLSYTLPSIPNTITAWSDRFRDSPMCRASCSLQLLETPSCQHSANLLYLLISSLLA